MSSGVPPIRGVIQGAIALHDSIFERMTYAKWQAALKPKHAATWNLHNALPDLEFFVMLSSLTGVGDSTSQGKLLSRLNLPRCLRQIQNTSRPSISVD